jgi:inhibitor of growth protein 4
MELERALCSLEPLPPALRALLDSIAQADRHILELEQALQTVSQDPQQYDYHTDPALLHALIAQLAEHKAHTGLQAYDLIDQHICAVDTELARVEAQLRERYKGVPPGPVTAPYARERGAREGVWELRQQQEGESVGGSRRASVVSLGSEPDVEFPFDPNEPTYCVCGRPSFGNMIQCEDEECGIEWFHTECVGLTTLPKGKWYCAQCSAVRKR